MPHGVSDQFVRILGNERKGSLRAILLAVALLPLAYFMAELTDEPFLGLITWLALLALAAGAVLGVLYARHQTERYNASLRQSWNQWMRMSLSCASIHEVAAHVQNKRTHVGLRGASAALLVILNGALFAFLWFDVGFAFEFGAIVTGMNGLVLGFLAGHAAWSWRWTAQFAKALDELINDGQVGLWGEL